MEPLYFLPDPNIDDSELLGFGDVFYSDGTSRYASGDPEFTAGLSPLPPGMSPQQGSMSMGPPAPFEMGPPSAPSAPSPIIESNQGPMQLDQMGNFRPAEGVQDPNTGELLDPGPTSGMLPGLGRELGNALQGYPQPLGQAWQEETGGGSPAAPAQGMQPVTFQTDQGQPVTLDPMGNLKPGAGGIPIEQLQQQAMGGAGGMVPVQREGALPPDVAARQLGDLGAAQSQTFAATEQARRDEVRMMNELTLKQMAINEAQRHQLAQEQADNEAKVERWRAEQQATIDMQIKDDLLSARGPIGGGLMAVGAALLGAAGNDMGFRMIDRDVDRYVRQQVARRDTKLGILAEQIGSAQQAIKLGKAQMFQALSEHVDLLAQKTKNDIYEAQSPAVLAKLHELQVKEMQEAEKISLGKTLEKAPLPPKPPSAEMLQKYGELRRARQTDSGIGQRAEKELGLVWDPKTQDFINKKAVLQDGIQGIGALEQWVPNFVYSTMGGVTAEGYQVRGAAEAMAFAQLKQMQPSGIPTQKDIEGAVRAGAYNTEEGFVEALRRMRIATEEQRQHDAAEFGADVVAEYDRRFQAAGGVNQTSSPAASRPPNGAELSAEIQRRRAPQQEPEARGPGNLPPPTPEELQQSIMGFAQSANLNPEAVARVIGHESGGKPGATNALTSKHAGLIQFSKDTWAGLAKEAGTPDVSWDDMRKMSAEEQLPYVMQYFERLGLGPDNDAGDYAMAAFMPAFWQQPDDFVLGLKNSRDSIGGLSMHKVWAQNPGLRNGDRITVGDVRRSVL